MNASDSFTDARVRQIAINLIRNPEAVEQEIRGLLAIDGEDDKAHEWSMGAAAIAALVNARQVSA